MVLNFVFIVVIVMNVAQPQHQPVLLMELASDVLMTQVAQSSLALTNAMSLVEIVFNALITGNVL